VVEFFDYRCGYCRKTSASVLELASGGKVRVIFKELPILGPESVTLAKAGLAAHRQGMELYLKFHEAAMASREPVTTDSLGRIAGKAGLNVDRLLADMSSPDVQKALDRNAALAEALGVRATPTFVIGSEKVEGAIDDAALSSKIAKLRSEAGVRAAAPGSARRSGQTGHSSQLSKGTRP
jgi:protein-disulfide isomerase